MHPNELSKAMLWKKELFIPRYSTASAIVYTLAETAKVNGLNIRLYLETVMTKMLDYKNESESILEDLMPWSEMMQDTCSLNKH